VAFLLESNVEENQLSPEEAQQLWDEEAAKLNADDQPLDQSADQAMAAAPEDPLLEDEPIAEEAVADVEPEDPLASLPEAVRAKLAQIDQLAEANAQLLHHVKTAEGRVAAMQREFQQARVAQQQVAPQEAPSQGQIVSAAKNPEKWEQLKQDFPEWAGAMEEYVASQLGSVRPQNDMLTPEQVTGYVQQQVEQTKSEMRQALEEARIEGKYENWRELVNTLEFTQWYAVQPTEIRALADSTAARDAIRMLDMFHETKKRSASDIKQERSQRLSAAATTRPGQTPPPKTLDDMSPEELWNYEAAKREKTRAQRGF
jgi:uncharacterized protein YhaN